MSDLGILTKQFCDQTIRLRKVNAQFKTKRSTELLNRQNYRDAILSEMLRLGVNCISTNYFDKDGKPVFLVKSTCTSKRVIDEKMITTTLNTLFSTVTIEQWRKMNIHDFVSIFQAQLHKQCNKTKEHITIHHKTNKNNTSITQNKLTSSMSDMVTALIQLEQRLTKINQEQKDYKTQNEKKITDLEKALLLQVNEPIRLGLNTIRKQKRKYSKALTQKETISTVNHSIVNDKDSLERIFHSPSFQADGVNTLKDRLVPLVCGALKREKQSRETIKEVIQVVTQQH